jgi:hypothetical protein
MTDHLNDLGRGDRRHLLRGGREEVLVDQRENLTRTLLPLVAAVRAMPTKADGVAAAPVAT